MAWSPKTVKEKRRGSLLDLVLPCQALATLPKERGTHRQKESWNLR